MMKPLFTVMKDAVAKPESFEDKLREALKRVEKFSKQLQSRIEAYKQ